MTSSCKISNNNELGYLSVRNIKVSIDGPSLDLLQGSYIDFAQELMGAAFVIRNPNAASSCGCGSSFSVF